MKFQNVKVGDKLWSIQLEECEVRIIRHDCLYAITCVDSAGSTRSYTFEGLFSSADKTPSLFFSKPEIIEPKRKVTKTVEVWVNVNKHGTIRVNLSKETIKWLIGDNDILPITKGTLTYETEE